MANIRYIANVLNQKGAPAIFEDTAANRPAAGFTGRIFISTDTFAIQRDNGTGWDSLGGGSITGTGAAGQVTFWTGASAVSGDNTFFWDNTNKRLGIGINTPSWPITSYAAGVNASYSHYINGSTGPGSANGSLFGVDGSGNATILVQGSFNFNLYTGGTARVTFDNAGKVGFGYTTPGITGISVSNAIYQGLNVANGNFQMLCNQNFYTVGFSPNFSTYTASTVNISISSNLGTGYVFKTTASITVNLPAASGLNNQLYFVVLTGTTVTVNRSGADVFINNAGSSVTSLTLVGHTKTLLYSDGGATWYQIF